MSRSRRFSRSSAATAAVGDTRGASPGNKWCGANAIAEYADFGRGYTRRSNKVQRSFEDTLLRQRNFELLLEA